MSVVLLQWPQTPDCPEAVMEGHHVLETSGQMVAFQDALGSQILKNVGWWFSATLAGWENTHPQWNFTCLQQIYHFLKKFLKMDQDCCVIV